MKLKTWQEGLKKIIDHIIQLHQDGDFLAENGSYNHAYFLYYTALEELTKAYFILARFDKPAPKEFRRNLRDHRLKAQSSARIMFNPEIEDLPDVIEILKESKSKIPKFGSIQDFRSKEFQFGIKLEKRKKLEYWRNRSIYVDIHYKNSDFLTPDSIPIEIVKELKERLKIELAELQALCDTYFHYKNDLLPINEFKNIIETQKTLDEFIKVLELYNIALSGSKEELNKLNGAPSEFKELFLSILEDEDFDENFDETLIDRVMNKSSELIEKIQNLDTPKSELEQNQSLFYNKRLYEYFPDYDDKISQEFTSFMRTYYRQFLTKLGALDDLNPQELENIINLGIQNFFSLLNIKSDDKELLTKFGSQLEKTPNNKELLSNLGELYSKVGFYQNAYSCFKKIYKLDNNNANAIYYLGELNLRVRGKIKKALSFYKKIEDYYEDDSKFWLVIGNLYEYKKKYKKALEYYWKAIYIDFETDEAWYRIGVINNRKGKTEKAKLLISIALKIKPFHEEAKELLNQLDSLSDLRNNNISFRETSNKDLDYLFELKKINLKEYIEKTWGWDEKWQRDYLVSNFNPKKTHIIIKSEKDIGCFVVRKNRKYFMINLFLITPKYQNQGIGLLILKFIIKEAKKHNKSVLINVLKVNNRALDICEKIGFKKVGEDNERYHLVFRNLQN